MDKISVFSKTGKGLLQLKYRSHQLSENQLRVLGLIDGKTRAGDLTYRSRMNEADLYDALKALAASGFIRELAVPVAAADPLNPTCLPVLTPEADLDFTRDLTVGTTFKHDV